MSGKLEAIAQATTPIPISISGATLLGITVQDWVLMGTAVLVVFQLIVITPKVIKMIGGWLTRSE